MSLKPMLVDSGNLVTTEQFRKNLHKYVAAARQGSGPIAVVQDSEVVAFFIGAPEYEAWFGAAVKRLLRARSKGPTVSHKQVRARIQRITRRGAGTS